MRSFIGIPLDGKLAERVAAIELPQPGRRIAGDNLHLTLVFLGNQLPGVLAELSGALKALPPRQRFDLGFNGLAPFPRGSSAIAAVMVEDSESLTGLQAQIAATVQAMGIPLEERPFRPHLTVARSRRRFNFAPISLDWRMTVVGYRLYRSISVPGGSRYEVLAEFPLS